MSKFLFISFGLLTILTACGGGSKDEPDVGSYGYNGVGGFANQCSPRVAILWNRNIATKCNNVNGQQMARDCAIGAENFRRSVRARALPCNIAVADAQWGGGQWQQPQPNYFEINECVLDDIMSKHGWAIGRPNRFGQPGQCVIQGQGPDYGRPGHPGQPDPGNGPGPGPRF